MLLVLLHTTGEGIGASPTSSACPAPAAQLSAFRPALEDLFPCSATMLGAHSWLSPPSDAASGASKHKSLPQSDVVLRCQPTCCRYYPGDTLEEMRSRLERCLAPPSEPQ